MCISFENFDEFNVEFGENAGDRLLPNIAKRLTATLPDSYWAASTRNANYFVFKASAITTSEDVDFKSLPAQLKEILYRPFLINNDVTGLRANVGWTTIQKPVNSLELYRQAELSLSVNTETG
jgi:GGDEF domain-containing protein